MTGTDTPATPPTPPTFDEARMAQVFYAFVEEWRRIPTVRDLIHWSESSRSRVYELLNRLDEKGIVMFPPNRRGCLDVTDEGRRWYRGCPAPDELCRAMRTVKRACRT